MASAQNYILIATMCLKIKWIKNMGLCFHFVLPKITVSRGRKLLTGNSGHSSDVCGGKLDS